MQPRYNGAANSAHNHHCHPASLPSTPPLPVPVSPPPAMLGNTPFRYTNRPGKATIPYYFSQGPPPLPYRLRSSSFGPTPIPGITANSIHDLSQDSGISHSPLFLHPWTSSSVPATPQPYLTVGSQCRPPALPSRGSPPPPLPPKPTRPIPSLNVYRERNPEWKRKVSTPMNVRDWNTEVELTTPTRKLSAPPALPSRSRTPCGEFPRHLPPPPRPKVLRNGHTAAADSSHHHTPSKVSRVEMVVRTPKVVEMKASSFRVRSLEPQCTVNSAARETGPAVSTSSSLNTSVETTIGEGSKSSVVDSYSSSIGGENCSNSSRAGFSTKSRRKEFRSAMCEIEDMMRNLDNDFDLLDRAERRDLPTAHQELIVRARNGGDASDKENDNGQGDSVSPRINRRGPRRTPSYRRSAIPDKVTDDMVFRFANRPQSSTRSRSQSVMQPAPSYMELTGQPHRRGGQMLLRTRSQNALNRSSREPDVEEDDVHFRKLRDSLSSPSGTRWEVEREPPFGIPRASTVFPFSSPRDYLHAVPNGQRYRSRFNAMRNPDQVTDDLAFRALRKDAQLSQPHLLGIGDSQSEENQARRRASISSCWFHKTKEREFAQEPAASEEESPVVFYPKKDHALIQSVCQDMQETIRRQSLRPGGGDDSSLVTYEKAVSNASGRARELGGDSDDEEEEWRGKTVFELLSSSGASSGAKPKESEAIRTAQKEPSTLIIQHCQMQYDNVKESLEKGAADFFGGTELDESKKMALGSNLHGVWTLFYCLCLIQRHVLFGVEGIFTSSIILLLLLVIFVRYFTRTT